MAITPPDSPLQPPVDSVRPTADVDRVAKSGQIVVSQKIVRFDDLTSCGDEVWIEYRGKLYRLQTTRQGKLLLTK